MNLKARVGAILGAFGAKLPIDFAPVTTPDDSFEEDAAEWLRLWRYPTDAHRTHRNRAWPSGKTYVRPDLLTMIEGTELVVFVGDAKRHAILETRHVKKVEKYMRVTKAETAAVFIPQTCKVGPAIQAYADRVRVEIIRL